MNYFHLLYPGVIAIGIITTYTDIRYKLIKNRHLLWAIAYGITIYTYIFFNYPNLSLSKIILNIIIAFFIGFFLYLKRLWSTGDAKLFIVLSFLIPPSKYELIFKFPAITLFVNTIIISVLLVMIFSLKNIFTDSALLKSSFSASELRKIILSLLISFSIMWLIWLAADQLKVPDTALNLAGIYIAYYLVYGLVMKFKSYKLICFIIFLIGGIARIIIQPQMFLVPANLLRYILILIKYTLIFKLLDVFFNSEQKTMNEKKTIAFAPFIFLGAITTNTGIIYYILRFLKF